MPERFELGTLPYELLAGVTAGVDFIAGLAPGDAADRRDRVVASMTAVEAHEDVLFDRLLDRAGGDRRRHAARPAGAAYAHRAVLRRRAHRPRGATRRWPRAGVNAPASSFYAIEASRHAGLGDDGAVRAGIAPYTSTDEVDRLVDAVSQLATAR